MNVPKSILHAARQRGNRRKLPPRFYVRVGKTADGRDAFAVVGPVVCALGDYYHADAYVRDSSSCTGITDICRPAENVVPGDERTREIVAHVKGRGRWYRYGAKGRFRSSVPLFVAQSLGWLRMVNGFWRSVPTS